MRICITLDDVLRNKTYQFGKIYKKYVNPDIRLEELDMSSGNLQEIFGFKDKDAYNKFLYQDYAFEIFAEASVCDNMLDKNLNLWQLRLEDDDDLKEPCELLLSNTMEFNQSIGCTYFFASKLATRIREIFLPKDSSEIFDKCDVLITADPLLLNSKQDKVITIKIKTDYNTSCPSDYEYDSLQEFLKDDKIIYEIQKEKGL